MVVTSLIVKIFEKIIIVCLGTTQTLDPHQCSYRAGRGVEDTTGTLLNLILDPLDGANHLVQLCINFSLAFNSIQRHILADQLTTIHNIDLGLMCWVVDYFI